MILNISGRDHLTTMRKSLFLFLFLLTTITGLKAQTVIYSQSFEDTNWLFNGYVLRNYDHGTAVASGWDTLSTSAWVVAKVGSTNNHAACATSDYSPAIAADDWFITPAIRLGEASKLSWKSLSLLSDKTDNYQVFVSTTDQSPGGCWFNGVAGSFTSSQSSGFLLNTFDLAAAGFKNQNVYIGFRLNTASGGGVIALDDLNVTEYKTNFVNLTFTVNLSNYIASGKFKPFADTVDIAGNFNSWDGTRHILSMVPGSDSAIYSITVPGFLDGDKLEFKFRINSTFADSIVEFPYGAPNRSWTIEHDRYFYNCFYNDQGKVYGVDDSKLMSSVVVYPNPASEIIALKVPEEISFFEMRDVQGKMIFRQHNNGSGTKMIDVSDYPKGIYTISFYSGTKWKGGKKLILN